MKVSESILKWLSENKDWFKDAAIVKKVGIDKGNFSKYKKSGDIPEKYLQPIMNIIMPLGFTLEEVIAENKKPENKKKRDTPTNTSNKEMPLGLDEMGQEIWQAEQDYLTKKHTQNGRK